MELIVNVFFLSAMIMLAPHMSEKVAIRLAIFDLIMAGVFFGVDHYIKAVTA